MVTQTTQQTGGATVLGTWRCALDMPDPGGHMPMPLADEQERGPAPIPTPQWSRIKGRPDECIARTSPKQSQPLRRRVAAQLEVERHTRFRLNRNGSSEAIALMSNFCDYKQLASIGNLCTRSHLQACCLSGAGIWNRSANRTVHSEAVASGHPSSQDPPTLRPATPNRPRLIYCASVQRICRQPWWST